MSSRNILEDGQVPIPGSPSGRTGKYFELVSAGGNQAAGKELEPHSYSMTLWDRYISLRKSTNPKTGATSYGPSEVRFVQTRAWTAADDYALYSALEEQYDMGDFNAGIFAGEIGKTADMIADRARQLARAGLAAKRGNFARAAQILGGGRRTGTRHPAGRKPPKDVSNPDGQRVSDGWLELQYGWLPVIRDVYSLSDTISKIDKPRTKRIVARHNIRLKPIHTYYYSSSATSGGGRYGKQIVAYITEDIPSWPEALGLTDPELIAWELTPFSFVADWFIPIGGWLQARAFAQRAKGKFVLTETTNFHGSCPPGVRYQSPSLVVEDLEPAWTKYVKVTRTVSTSLPSVPLPTFDVGLTKGNRLWNALALLTNIFSGRR